LDFLNKRNNNSNALFLRLYYLKDVEIKENIQTVKRLFVVYKENIEPRKSFSEVTNLLKESMASKSSKEFVFENYFGEHSKQNMSFLVYPSTVLDLGEDHHHLVVTEDQILVQDLVIKKAKSFN
jgi:hypothetical protein